MKLANMLCKKKIMQIISLILIIWIIFNLYASNYIYTTTRPVEYYGNSLQYHHRQLVNESFRFMLKTGRYDTSYIYVRKNIFGLRQFMVLSTHEDDPLMTVYHARKIGETVFGDYIIRTGNLSDDGRGKMQDYLDDAYEFKVAPLESEKFLYGN